MHSLLARQLKKLNLGADRVPDAAQWAQLLERIDRAYTQNDQDRYLHERSLAVSSAEMQELYNDLRERSASKLRAQHERLRAVMNNVRDGILTTDRDGNIDSFNTAALKIFGYTEEEFSELNINTLIDVKSLPSLRRLLREEWEMHGINTVIIID